MIAAKRIKAINPQKASGVRIFLDKRIPVAAGLGGGSSDAAATMKGLVRFWGLKVSLKKLMEEGAQVGSDVPFFLSGYGMAWGKGRGEKIVPVKQTIRFWTLIATPTTRVSTKMVYSYIDTIGSFLTRSRPNARMQPRSFSMFSDIVSLVFNDLQQVTITYKPVVGKLLSCLRSLGAQGVAMSGSGPSVYALFPSKKEAIQTRSRLRRLYRGPLSLNLAETLESTSANGFC
jgi:4-diphosphocytidyl-2-C-methyl-D-erythritol kinase